MSVSFDEYIESLVRPIGEAIPLFSGKRIKTRKITDLQRLRFTKTILGSLTWLQGGTLYCSSKGFIGTVRDQKTNKLYLVVCIQEKIIENDNEIRRRAESLKLTPADFEDPFRFFVCNELTISLAKEIDPRELPEMLNIQQEGDTVTADYNVLVKCYGAFHVFEIDDKSDTDLEFVELLFSNETGDNTISTQSDCYEKSLGGHDKQTLHILRMQEVAQRLLKTIADVRPVSQVILQEPKQSLLCIRDIRVAKDRVLSNQAGGFVLEYQSTASSEDVIYLAMSAPGLSEGEKTALIEYLLELGLNNQDILQPTLVGLIFHVDGIARLKSQYSDEQALIDRIPANSMDFRLAEDIFEPILVFKKESDCAVTLWEIMAGVAAKFKRFRSPFISNEILDRARSLIECKAINHENIYLSLTGAHWKHCFLEIYRLIEGLYYFGWMKKLKTALSSDISEFDLYKICSKDARWKIGEQESIAALFELVPEEVFIDLRFQEISCIKSKFEKPDDHTDSMRKFASAIYAVRNSAVHQGETDDERTITVNAESWPQLILALYKVVEYFYLSHPTGMPRDLAEVEVEAA
jgi:hypothetical protein